MKTYLRFLLLIIALTCANVSTAQPMDIKTYGERLYNSCVSSENSAIGQKFCGCLSQKMVESITIDEIKSSGEKTPQSKASQKKILEKVYVPCIGIPAYVSVYESCINHPEVKAISNYIKICECTANSMVVRIQGVGSVPGTALATMEKAWNENPNANPFQAVFFDEQFGKASGETLSGCIAVQGVQ